ncbi:MAG: hypothetical protein K6B70_04320 [Clostridia bacterium]|nr:hypothetical protein [Clostridia bacterium]
MINKIPGNLIPYDKTDEIAKKILSVLNPNDLPPLEMWKELTVLNKDSVIQLIKNSLSKNYYLLYTYYLKKILHRVFLAEKEEVIKFLNDNFDEEWDEGMDIIIADSNYETIIMGNHDGVLLKR